MRVRGLNRQSCYLSLYSFIIAPRKSLKVRTRYLHHSAGTLCGVLAIEQLQFYCIWIEWYSSVRIARQRILGSIVHRSSPKAQLYRALCQYFSHSFPMTWNILRGLRYIAPMFVIFGRLNWKKKNLRNRILSNNKGECQLEDIFSLLS